VAADLIPALKLLTTLTERPPSRNWPPHNSQVGFQVTKFIAILNLRMNNQASHDLHPTIDDQGKVFALFDKLSSRLGHVDFISIFRFGLCHAVQSSMSMMRCGRMMVSFLQSTIA
jgi:hypothetical protein